MAIDLQALTEHYASALRNYCLNPDRADLTARDLGQQAAALGLTMADVIQIDQQALDGWQPAAALPDGIVLARRASDFLAQSLLPFEQQRQQTETALRQSEAQFRAIFEHAAIGIVMTDHKHQIAHANLFFQNTLQYSAAELAAFSFTHITHPDDVALEQPLVNECLAGTRDTYRLEKRYIRKDGGTVWSDMTGTVVRDAIGQIQYAVVTMTDITAQQAVRQERQQAETALQQLNTELESRVQARTAELAQKNAELEALFQILPDSFFRVAADGTYLECKGQSPQDFYLPPEELVGRKVQEVLPPPLGQKFHAIYQEVLRHNELVSIEYALTIDGTEKHFEARFVPMQPDQVMAIVRNISDRHQAEAALRLREAEIRRSRDLFAGIFEAAADAIFLVSPVTNCITKCNQRAVELFEVESQVALIGVVGSIFHKEPFSPEAVATAHSALETIGGWNQETEYVTHKGNTFWGYCTAKRLQIDGEPLHLVRVTDITDRKEAESQKASLYAQLETELAERRYAEQTIAQQMQRERLLRTISQQIRQSLRLDQILATTVTEIQRLLGAERAVVFRFNRDRSGVVIQEANLGSYPTVLEMYLTDRHFPPESYAFYLKGQARIIDRASDRGHTACFIEFMEQIGVKTEIVAPILQTLEGETPIVWGLLIVHACADYRQWQLDEVALLQQLATQVGIAIQQADLYTQIKSELTQKEVLLKEIHHRVKNNLQVVSALLALQADSVQDATVLAALQDSDNRLQAMALIHETLYQSDNLGPLNFSHYIQRLADSILLANSRRINTIELIYKLEPIFLNLETAIPCGLLLNELITNAIKHAFPPGQRGTICLSLQHTVNHPAKPDPSISIQTAALLPQDAPHYILSVSDNGIGMPTHLNLEDIKSLGLRIASDLAQQLRGSLVLERQNGTQFHLTFADLSYCKRL